MSVEGVAELTRQLQALGKLEDGKAIRASVRAAMKPALDRARQLIPKGTDKLHRTYKGRLVAPGFASRSVRMITTVSRDKQQAAAVLGVRREAFYAVQFVELGTSKQPARPWLRPAFKSTRDQQLAAMQKSLQGSINRARRQR
jgi:HK97 gp10 family phage protein